MPGRRTALVPTDKKKRARPDSLIQFTDQISFQGPPELRESLTAISYLEGDMGAYAATARKLLTKAIRQYVGELDPSDRREYDKIMVNVKAKLLVTRNKRLEEQRARRLRAKSMAEESETVLVTLDDDDPDSPAFPE